MIEISNNLRITAVALLNIPQNMTRFFLRRLERSQVLLGGIPILICKFPE